MLAREAMRTAKEAVKLAQVFGLTGNFAILAAENYMRSKFSEPLLEGFGMTHLLADQRGVTYGANQRGMTYGANDLGAMCDPPLSGIALYKRFEALNLISRDAIRRPIPEPAAEGLYEWLDTNKTHGGTPVKQLKWFPEVLDKLGVVWHKA